MKTKEEFKKAAIHQVHNIDKYCVIDQIKYKQIIKLIEDL